MEQREQCKLAWTLPSRDGSRQSQVWRGGCFFASFFASKRSASRRVTLATEGTQESKSPLLRTARLCRFPPKGRKKEGRVVVKRNFSKQDDTISVMLGIFLEPNAKKLKKTEIKLTLVKGIPESPRAIDLFSYLSRYIRD